MITTKEIAEKLNGSEYPCKINDDLQEELADNEIVVVFGASDDLIEFFGAIYDEAGCYDGGTVKFDAQGLIPSWDDVCDYEDDAEEYFKRKSVSKEIEAKWCEVENYSWAYEVDFPHETFEINDGDEKYCRGIVFSLKDVFELEAS